ncbi:hypothetical protein AB0B79_09045 [Streptomyces sp. NPDC039022]|uniref:hypothetical protein n=1 Tax=unclassified Streptomyces TaxID=2593676 RepID=UPI0033E969D7
MATDRSRPMKTGLLPPSSTAVAPAPSREVIIQGDGPAPALAHGAGAGVFGHYGLALDDLARDRAVIGPHHPGAGGTRSRPAAPTRLPDRPVGLRRDNRRARHISRRRRVTGLRGGRTGRAPAPRRITALVLTAGFAATDPVLRLTAQLIRTLGRSGELTTAARLAGLSC